MVAETTEECLVEIRWHETDASPPKLQQRWKVRKWHNPHVSKPASGWHVTSEELEWRDVPTTAG